MSADDHVAQNVVTYNAIAQHNHLTAPPGLRPWKEASMRRCVAYLPSNAGLVPEYDDGRKSHYLATFGLSVTSFDLSDDMLATARCRDPGGDCRRPDLRDLTRLDGTCDGIWASGCLYHPTKPEFARCVEDCHVLAPNGVLYLTMKKGDGEYCEDSPARTIPPAGRRKCGFAASGSIPITALMSSLPFSKGFELLREQRVEPSDEGFELWLRRG